MKNYKHKIFIRLRNNIFFKYFLKSTGKKIDPSKWVFIIGCYNSGTTLLDNILQSHKKIVGFADEGTILTGYLNRPEDFTWQRMWCECYNEVKFDGSPKNLALANSVKRHWSHFLPKDNNKLVLEKSIVNATRIPFFNAFFQPAYFIYLVRNGYAVAEGIQRKSRPGKYGNTKFPEKYSFYQAAKQWQATHDVVQEAKGKVANFLEIRYEDLTENPTAALGKIANFLDVSAFSNDKIKDEYQIHGLESPISNQNGESFKRLDKSAIQEIETAAGDALKHYGYWQKHDASS